MSVAVPIVPYLVSSWLNVSMYAFELVLCGVYFTRRPHPRINKAGVWALIFADGLCVLSININVCQSIMRGANQLLFVAPIAVQIMTTYISAAIAQLFFCNLFYALTRHVWVSGALQLLIFVHLGFSWASAILLLLNPTTIFGISFTVTAVGAISCAATDLIIAICLATKFTILMRGTIPGHATRTLVRRILILTVASGAVCATITLLMMIFLLRNNPAFNFLFVLQGRVYALSILGNFLLGIPGNPHEETTPSQRFGSTFNDSVVFRIPSMVPKGPRPKSSDASGSGPRSVAHETQFSAVSPFPYTGDGEESVHLEDLRSPSSCGKANFEEA
ncbi:hypothetical protein B0H14DRAFT_2686719 [Mycena olivaceomarginata]|nr:hypothetical protein B0H14DRAFT_2686719 [Mycena olivaceomarginata]